MENLKSTNASIGKRPSVLDPIAGVDYLVVQNAHPYKQVTINKESVAKLCHEVTRLFCEMTGDVPLVPWDQAPDWQKASAIAGVDFHVNNTATTPRDSHMSWLKQKQEDGWKFGPIKDADKKEHPCFCSYDNLPWYQQLKDYLFTSIVHVFKGMLRAPNSPQTNGERIAGLSFNPSGDWRIHYMKQNFAELYDLIEKFEAQKDAELKADKPDDTFALGQVHRSASMAKTELQHSKMDFVEAITR